MGMIGRHLMRGGLSVLRQLNQALPILVLLGVVFLLIAIWWLGPQLVELPQCSPWWWSVHHPTRNCWHRHRPNRCQ